MNPPDACDARLPWKRHDPPCTGVTVVLTKQELEAICFAFGERGIPNKGLDLVYAKMLKLYKDTWGEGSVELRT